MKQLLFILFAGLTYYAPGQPSGEAIDEYIAKSWESWDIPGMAPKAIWNGHVIHISLKAGQPSCL